MRSFVTVQSQLAMSIATCGLTHFLEYATVNFILQTLSSVMIWVTTFLVCLEVMMHYTKCPDTKSNHMIKWNRHSFCVFLKAWEWGYQATRKCWMHSKLINKQYLFIPTPDSYHSHIRKLAIGLLLLFFKAVESWVWHWKQSYLIPIAMNRGDSAVSNCTTSLMHWDLSIIISYWHLLAWGVSLPTD